MRREKRSPLQTDPGAPTRSVSGALVQTSVLCLESRLKMWLQATMWATRVKPFILNQVFLQLLSFVVRSDLAKKPDPRRFSGVHIQLPLSMKCALVFFHLLQKIHSYSAIQYQSPQPWPPKCPWQQYIQKQNHHFLAYCLSVLCIYKCIWFLKHINLFPEHYHFVKITWGTTSLLQDLSLGKQKVWQINSVASIKYPTKAS